MTKLMLLLVESRGIRGNELKSKFITLAIALLIFPTLIMLPVSC